MLSFFIPGLGQIYKGQIGAGIFLLIFTVIGYLVFIVPGLVIHLIAVIGAYNGSVAPKGRYMLVCVKCNQRTPPGPSTCERCGNSLKGAGSTVVATN